MNRNLALTVGAAVVLLAMAAAVDSRLGDSPSRLNNQVAMKTMKTSRPEIPSSDESVRPAAVAGAFYPGDPQDLADTVDDLLADAGFSDRPGRPRLVISPHAGYEYSGPVAAHAFKILFGTGYRRAVLIGRSHRANFDGVAADTRDRWATPLGEVAVDQEFIARLLGEAGSGVRRAAAPHDEEHSLEVMLPFLQRVLGTRIEIVPLLLGSEDYDSAIGLGRALTAVLDDSTVVIVSTDLSHYPSYEEADRLDEITIGGILTGDVLEFREAVSEAARQLPPNESTAACGEAAVAAGLDLAGRFGWRPTLLKYANSGDSPIGDRSRVVGYAAMAFDGPREILMPAGAAELDAAARAEALEIARETLRAAFRDERYEPHPHEPALLERRGAFVTLKKRGALRGCIGVFEPVGTLAEAIRDMAFAAAFDDGRFPELAAGELPDIEIEVSVLSPLVRVADAGLIEVGRHGVAVSRGDQRGVFLPQVAAEQGWDRETFLRELCVSKAGFDADCWEDPEIDVQAFTAQVFGD